MTKARKHGQAHQVPFPFQWRGSGSGLRRGMAFGGVTLGVVFTLMALVFVVETVNASDSSGWLMVAVFVLLGPVPLAVYVHLRRWPGRRVVRVESADVGGLNFRTSGLLWWVALGLVLVAVLMPVAVLLEWLTEEHLSRQTRRFLLFAPFMAAWGVWQCANLLAGRLRRGGVFVTRAGVTHRSFGAESFLAWDDVEPGDPAAGPGEWSGPVDLGHGPMIQLVARKGRSVSRRVHARGFAFPARGNEHLPRLKVPARWIEGDAALLAHAVAWYARHPNSREELADDRAYRRVVAGHAVPAEQFAAVPPEMPTPLGRAAMDEPTTGGH